MINKVVQSIEKALIGVESEMTLMFGGSGFLEYQKTQLKHYLKKIFLI